MAATNPHASSSKTLFVRNLPYKTTSESLETIFSEFGPTKRAFVVKDKGSEKCKGFGYVTFSILEDAVKAQSKLKTIQGRKIHILFAEKKKKEKRSKPDEATDELSKDDSEEEKEPESTGEEKPARYEPSKHDQYKTVVLTKKLSSAITDIHSIFKERNVKNVDTVFQRASDDPNTEVSHVRFKSVRDAKRGCRKLNSKDWKDKMLKASLLAEVPRKPQVTKPQKDNRPQSQAVAPKVVMKSKKDGRLIIRNLSFKCQDKDVQSAFEKFGPISEVMLPKKPGGKPSGFGFVQFTEVSDASKAISQMNGQQILGRPIAVDWSIQKNKYKAAKLKEGQSETAEQNLVKKDEANEDSSESSEDESSEMSVEENDSSLENTASEVDSGNESDDDDSGTDEESEEDDESDTDDDSNSHMSDSIDSDESDEKEEKSKSTFKKKNLPPKRSDVDDGRTLFIRNVPFSLSEEELEETLAEYGDIAYCRLVLDPVTEHPKGTAFVQFKKKDAAENCLEKAKADAKNPGIIVQDRKLLIDVAVSREKVKELNVKDKKENENKDKRNLFLAREGLIRPGTEAAKGLSKSDLEKRMKVEAMKRQKLKNLNIFISTTRLCIRNLPISLDDKELKKVLLKVVNEKNSRITECRIMRDLARPNAEGVGKSRGFGFVTFTEHQHALKALQQANNNPDLFGKDRRPIVEFSLENKAALQAKERKLEKQKLRKEHMSKTGEKENIRQKRQQKPSKGTTVYNLSKLSKEDKEKKTEGKYGPKGLPTHWGAKVRHKPRSVQGPPKTKRVKADTSAGEMQSKQQKKEPKLQTVKKRKHKKMSDDFDKLVHSYKEKLMSASAEPSKKKAKWFVS